jgi:hypothetical protein
MSRQLNQAQIDAACDALANGTLPIDDQCVFIATPRHTYRAALNLKDIVYLTVRDQPIRGVVAAIVVRPAGVLYYVQWADCYQEGAHYEFELTTEAPL